jgi:hypothetical protein
MEQITKSTNNSSSVINSRSAGQNSKGKSYRDIELQKNSEINLNIFKPDEEKIDKTNLNNFTMLKKKRKDKLDGKITNFQDCINCKETEDFNVNMLKINLANNKNACEFDLNKQSYQSNFFKNENELENSLLDDFISSSINKILAGDNLKEKLILYFMLSNAENIIKKNREGIY